MPRALNAPGLNRPAGARASHGTRAIHAVGVFALMVTGYVCFEQFRPKEKADVAPTASTRALTEEPAAHTVAAWLGPGEVRMNIRVLGVAIRDGRAVALLKVNDAPTRAVLVGETLPGGAIVSAIEATQVSIQRGGTIIRVKVPRRAPDPAGLHVIPTAVRHD